jgi:hypothetical protein
MTLLLAVFGSIAIKVGRMKYCILTYGNAIYKLRNLRISIRTPADAEAVRRIVAQKIFMRKLHSVAMPADVLNTRFAPIAICSLVFRGKIRMRVPSVAHILRFVEPPNADPYPRWCGEGRQRWRSLPDSVTLLLSPGRGCIDRLAAAAFPESVNPRFRPGS